MGRPLFSKAFQTTPVVREVEPPCPYEKWSYINAFDPDADEFFDSEHAVYEDFVDLVDAPQSEEDEEEERDMLVVRLGSFDATPTSSPGSLSDRASPMAVGAEDPAFYGLREMENTENILSNSNSRAQLSDLRWGRIQPRLNSRRRATSTSMDPRAASPSRARGSVPSHNPVDRRDGSDAITLPPPSAPIPVPVVRSRRTAYVSEDVSFSPVTPSRQTPIAHVIPSPPPTSTPRLYSWARHPVSSSPGSPFTNAGARTSYTHLSPALIRIRDAMF